MMAFLVSERGDGALRGMLDALAEGLDDYICKPVNTAELAACMQR